MIFMAVVFIVIGAVCLLSAINILSGTYTGVTGAIQQTGVNIVYLRGAVYLLTSIVSVGLGVVLIGLNDLREISRDLAEILRTRKQEK